jgi:hypothetical protein
MVCSKFASEFPAELRANLLTGNAVGHRQDAGVRDLELKLLVCLHLLGQLGIGQIGGDAGVGEAPDIRKPVGRSWSIVIFTPLAGRGRREGIFATARPTGASFICACPEYPPPVAS